MICAIFRKLSTRLPFNLINYISNTSTQSELRRYFHACFVKTNIHIITLHLIIYSNMNLNAWKSYCGLLEARIWTESLTEIRFVHSLLLPNNIEQESLWKPNTGLVDMQ